MAKGKSQEGRIIQQRIMRQNVWANLNPSMPIFAVVMALALAASVDSPSCKSWTQEGARHYGTGFGALGRT